MTVAVVGDVRYDDVVRLAKKHFGQVAGPVTREPLKTVEPEQKGEKRLVIEHTAQPFIFMGFHKGGINDPDDYVYDALADLLGQGRTSRIYETVVKKDKLAVMAGCGASLPGTKYPNLFFVYGVPAKDIEPEQVEAALLAQIDKMLEEGVADDELAGVKRRARANFVRGLRSNQGLARQLAYYQAQTGDWRNLFKQVERIDAVTVADLRRVAADLFKSTNRTIAYIKTAKADEVAQGGQQD
jgi:predicted Zn-dependent peptidase